ncbi:MAG: TRAP transporter large permease [Syntrophomonadaceae bacterium]|jgi:tripartite ATP-independent transporter DctM subunit
MTLMFLIIFMILIFFGAPVAIALGSGVIVSLAYGDYHLLTFTHKMINSINSFSMIAVPLFIMAGNLCGETGIAKRLVKLSTALIGHIPGGTGLVNVLASMFFGGISGSSVADTAAIGGLLIPAMVEEGYDKEYSAGITIASSTIGILIPPSIPQVIYGLATGVSIGALFLGGFLPGVLVGMLQMVVAYFISKKRHYPCKPKASFKQIIEAFKETYLALILPLIIMIGVGFGIATASEVGVVAVLYALFIGIFVYKDYKISQLPKLLIDTAVTTSVALLVVGVASVAAYIINMEGIPTTLVNFFNSYIRSPLLGILLINLILFVVGMFLDLVPAMLLFAPILLPVAQSYGIDPIQFGCILTVNLGIGLTTPPIGNCLYIGAGIAKVEIFTLFKAALPFILCNILTLILICLWKPLTLWVPSLLGYF